MLIITQFATNTTTEPYVNSIIVCLDPVYILTIAATITITTTVINICVRASLESRKIKPTIELKKIA